MNNRAHISQTGFRSIIGTVGMLVCATVCLYGSAAAAEEGPPTKAVVYTGLDLASAAGRHELDRRLQQAAREVCSADSNMLQLRAEVSRCRAKAVADARTQITQKNVIAFRQ